MASILFCATSGISPASPPLRYGTSSPSSISLGTPNTMFDHRHPAGISCTPWLRGNTGSDRQSPTVPSSGKNPRSPPSISTECDEAASGGTHRGKENRTTAHQVAIISANKRHSGENIAPPTALGPTTLTEQIHSHSYAAPRYYITPVRADFSVKSYPRIKSTMHHHQDPTTSLQTKPISHAR